MKKIQSIINEQVDELISRTSKPYIKEQSSDWQIVFDKLTWHYNEDPRKALTAFEKAFATLKDKGYLNGAGEATYNKLQDISKRDNIGEADVFGMTDITLTSDDLTPPGIQYAKENYRFGVIK